MPDVSHIPQLATAPVYCVQILLQIPRGLIPGGVTYQRYPYTAVSGDELYPNPNPYARCSYISYVSYKRLHFLTRTLFPADKVNNVRLLSISASRIMFTSRLEAKDSERRTRQQGLGAGRARRR